MNAVNLLPVKHRPRTPTGGQQGSAYVVIGVLGVLVLMVLFYVLTLNGINQRRSQVARAKAETAQAQARAGALNSYGSFNKVKQERVQSVKDLAQGRIDWERLARGLARVLPDQVWLVSASASATGNPTSGGGASSSSSSSSSTPADGTAAAGPKVELVGCAPSHSVVAVTLVRLKELSGATDVQLNQITRPESSAATAGSSGSSSSGSSGSSTGGEDCGTVHGQVASRWDATVTFAKTPSAAATQRKVPRSLGGGA